MYKKFAVYALCLVISISFVGCQAGSNKHIDENDKIKQDEQIEQEVNTDIGNSGGQFTIDHEGKDTDEASDNNEDVEPIQQQYDNNPVPIDIERIQDTINDLNKIGISNSYAGYKNDGSLTVWVDMSLKSDYIDRNYDDPYTAKIIFDNLNHVENSFFWSESISGRLDFCSRKMYMESVLVDMPSDYEEFKKIQVNWASICKWYGFRKDYDVYKNVPMCFERQMQRLYGDRLIDVKVEASSNVMGPICGYVIVNGLPQDISVNDEIAKVLVMTCGRYDESFYFNQMEHIQIIYKKGNETVIDVIMFMGLDTPTEYDYLGWEASGLNPADWRKFTLRAEIYDESIDLQKKTDMAWLERGAIYEDPGYEKTWDMLEAFEGVKDIYLGYNGKSYAAVITLEHTEDEKDFQKEMDMTLLVMKYPFDKIVFLVEDNGKIINQACIDRKRFNTLMFMNEDMENAVFDFPPSEWPLMAKGFDTN